MTPDWVTLSLTAVNGLLSVINKGQFSEAERNARFELRRIKRMARVNLAADKLKYRRIELGIRATMLGLDIAKKEGLDTEKLRLNLERLCNSLSEIALPAPSN